MASESGFAYKINTGRTVGNSNSSLSNYQQNKWGEIIPEIKTNEQISSIRQLGSSSLKQIYVFVQFRYQFTVGLNANPKFKIQC